MMRGDLNINLAGIPDERWKERAELCADCRRDLATMREGISEADGEEADADADDGVPLLLWRNKGREMLRLCWPCASKRITAGETASGA